MMQGTSIAAALERRAELFGGDRAIVQGRTSLSWAQFNARASDFAGFLTARGVDAGARVAIGMQNSSAYLVALLAALKLGAVPVNVNYRYRPDELHHVLEDSFSRVLVHDAALSEVVAQVQPRLPHLATTVTTEPDVGPASSVSFEEALRTAPRHGRVDHGEGEWLLYTGGTTGRPKAVVRSQRSVLAMLTAGVCASLGVTAPASEGDLEGLVIERHAQRPAILAASPLMHGTGIYAALTALLAGGAVVLLSGGRFDARELAREVGRNSVSDLYIVGDAFAVPLVEALDLAAADGKPHDLTGLRRIQSVGTVLSASTKRRLLAHADITITDVIAATEGGPFAIAIADRSTPGEELSTFRLAPRARLLAPDDSDVVPGSGAVGVLAAPAPEEAHYAHDPAGTSEAFRRIDGVVYSIPGDLALMNADGALQLLGRGSSVINTGGEKVYAGEVEDVLRSHPDVADAVVVGLRDERWGSIVAAVIVPQPDHTVEPQLLSAYVATQLADYKQPRRVAVVTELGRTASGKIDLDWARRTVLGDDEHA